jgi:hypothetical protein
MNARTFNFWQIVGKAKDTVSDIYVLVNLKDNKCKSSNSSSRARTCRHHDGAWRRDEILDARGAFSVEAPAGALPTTLGVT